VRNAVAEQHHAVDRFTNVTGDLENLKKTAGGTLLRIVAKKLFGNGQYFGERAFGTFLTYCIE